MMNRPENFKAKTNPSGNNAGYIGFIHRLVGLFIKKPNIVNNIRHDVRLSSLHVFNTLSEFNRFGYCLVKSAAPKGIYLKGYKLEEILVFLLRDKLQLKAFFCDREPYTYNQLIVDYAIRYGDVDMRTYHDDEKEEYVFLFTQRKR